MTAPCKDCPDRVVGCHSTCKRYTEYAKEREEIRKKRTQIRREDPTVFLMESANKVIWEMQRKRRK